MLVDEESQLMEWSCSWKHVLGGHGGLNLKNGQNSNHACLFPQTKTEWPNKKQDRWPFPVKVQHYHFPEVSSSKYGIFGRTKGSSLKSKGNCALSDKGEMIWQEGWEDCSRKPNKEVNPIKPNQITPQNSVVKRLISLYILWMIGKLNFVFLIVQLYLDWSGLCRFLVQHWTPTSANTRAVQYYLGLIAPYKYPALGDIWDGVYTVPLYL